jgi:sec-independent protein translocase protein TatA
MFGSLGFGEIALILLIVVVLFGANRVSDLGRGLGEGIRNFKKAMKDDEPREEPREKKSEK